MLKKNLDKGAISELLRPVISEFEELVIPEKVELLQNNAYSQNYAWMYSFEKKLKYRIEKLLRNKLTYSQEKILFGPGGAVSEGLSNAFAHGHRKRTDLPISVWAAVSLVGLGFAIEDKGPGFDFEKTLADFQKGSSFFHIAGNGFSLLTASTDFDAWYNVTGNSLFLLYPIDR